MSTPTQSSQSVPIARTACGGILSNPANYPSAQFQGETIYFCTNACIKAFLLAPEAFMRGEIEHPTDDN